MTGLVVVTPTFAGDLERFVLLRESMVRTGVALPHLAVVDDEDLDLVRRAAPSEGLTVVATSAVLGASLDRARRRGRRRWARKLRQALHLGTAHSGWVAQQLIKLAVFPVLDGRDALFVDSDTFFLRPVTEQDYRAPDGRLHLLEHERFPSGPSIRRYDQQCRAFLGLPPQERVTHTYVANGVPVHGPVVDQLVEHVERLHGRRFDRAFAERDATEYTAHGLFARHLHVGALVVPADLRYYWLFQNPDPAVLRAELALRLQRPEVRLGTIHSSLRRPVSHYRRAIEEAWT